MFQRNLLDADFVLEQRQELDPKTGLMRRRDIHPPVANMDVPDGDEQTWEEADLQRAADAELQPQSPRSGRFKTGLADFGVDKKGQNRRDKDKQPDAPGRDKDDDSA